MTYDCLSSVALALGCKKCLFSHSFWPRWLKQISFYRELNYLHSKNFSFSVFCLFPVKKKKKLNFYILFFKHFKNWHLCALRLVFVNEIKSSILFYLWNCRRRCIFRRAIQKRIFSMQIVFLKFYRKSLKQTIFDTSWYIFFV